MDRRRLLRSLPPYLIASSLPLSWHSASAAPRKLTAALLVPRSGDHAALGRSMERAALLAQEGNRSQAPILFDTAASGGAPAAARAARKAGASIILGPVFAGEVRGVVAAAGGIPVVSFSNDGTLLESGAFVMGLTAAQVTGALLRQAARAGLRKVAIIGGDDNWTVQARAAAAALAPTIDLTVFPQAFVDLPTDVLPDAVVITAPADLMRLQGRIAAAGILALGAFPSTDFRGEDLDRMNGALLASPDPTVFAGFSRAFEQRNGSGPGVIAGLAFDALRMTDTMRLGGGIDRSALLSASGFKGVCGDIRFRDDGSAARSLTILEITQGQLKPLAATTQS